MNVIAFSGSLREKSYNTALLRTLGALTPKGMTIEVVSLGNLPLYNQDIEDANFPPEATALKERIRSADGVIIAVPEFNRLPPGPLVNFLDWTSRPESEPNPWQEKPVAILGASSGARGASFAQYDIRRVMGYFNARVMNQPEVYLGNVKDKFDADLNLIDERTQGSLKKFLSAFATHLNVKVKP